MTSEFRLAARTLAKHPAFALTAVATLALGIGANTAIFSVVNQVLLNPAGVSGPDRVVAVRARYDKLALSSIPLSVPDFADIESSRAVFQSAAILRNAGLNSTGHGAPERLEGATVTYRWFEVFGARPALGRVFSPEEDKPGANHVAVLSDPAWTRIFGRDPSVLGRAFELNQIPYRIIGVMGPDFRWPARADVWVPQGLPLTAYDPNNRFNESMTCFARLQPGVPLARATSFVQGLNNRVSSGNAQAAAYARASAWGMFLVPFTSFIAGDTRTPLLILLVAVGFVLLIACSNIAGLMLARASGRAREIAIRSALGAGRWSLVRQTLAESLLLATAGAVLGLAIAAAAARALLQLAPGKAPVTLAVRLDLPVLAFAVLAAALSAILFSLVPTFQVIRMGRLTALREGGRGGASSLARQRLRSALVVGEVALALVLLAGAGLFLRSLARLADVSPGFDTRGVVTAMLSLPQAQYDTPDKRAAFFTAVQDRLSHLPGVRSAAVGYPVPFTDDNSASFQIEGRPQPPGDPGPHGDLRYISSEYFVALRIPLRAGRFFTPSDRIGSLPVMIIDENLARQYWPNENPLGHRMRVGPNWSTIVGIVGHVKHDSLAADTGKGTYYIPMAFGRLPLGYLLVRSARDPVSLAASIRQAVQSVDPQQPVYDLVTMDSRVAASLGARRFVVTLLGLFAVLALLMAALGLYGVISYAVTQRTQEIGIRMALGARPRQVLHLVIAQGLRLSVAGGLLGLIASFGLSRWLRSELFAISPFDPVTFAVTAAVLLAAVGLASYIPASRATRVDPASSLRHE
ncbi:MAG: ABC transporter permease [Acidobacteriia bacterium]|nr:ABC transporter permease [Terriglobia bacterium]